MVNMVIVMTWKRINNLYRGNWWTILERMDKGLMVDIALEMISGKVLAIKALRKVFLPLLFNGN